MAIVSERWPNETRLGPAVWLDLTHFRQWILTESGDDEDLVVCEKRYLLSMAGWENLRKTVCSHPTVCVMPDND